MNINEKDFSDIPNGIKIAKVMIQLEKLPHDTNPNTILTSLMQEIQQSTPTVAIPAVLPCLSHITYNSTNLDTVRFTVFLILNFYSYYNISDLTDTDIIVYRTCLHTMRKRLVNPLLSPVSTDGWDDEFRSFYAYCTMLLHVDHPDILTIALYGKFDNAVKVTCLHCGNDLHSLSIDPAHPELSDNITPAPKPSIEKDQTPVCDFYNWSMNMLDALEEKTFLTALPYFYGEYKCSVCGEVNSVIEASKLSMKTNKEHFVPTYKFLARLISLEENLPTEPSVERFSMIEYIISIYYQLEGENSLDALLYHLNSGNRLPFSCRTEHLQNIGNHAVSVIKDIEITEENGEKLGDIYINAGLAYFYDYDEQYNTSHPDKLIDYCTKAKNCFDVGLGENSRKAHKALIYIAAITAESEGLSPLENLLADLIAQNAHQEDIAFCNKHILDIKAENNPELKIKTVLADLDKIAYEHGVESDIYADHLSYVAAAYKENNDLEKALEHCEKALCIHTKYLGKEYLVSSKLRPIIHIFNKCKKSAKSNDDIANHARSVAQCYKDLGELNFSELKFKLAIKNLNKGLDLWEWATKIKFIESAQFRISIGDVYRTVGDKGNATAYYNTAIAILKDRIANSEYQTEVLDAKLCLQYCNTAITELESL